MTEEQIIKDLNSEEILALTIYGESRGERIEGQVAVGCVIRNRTRAPLKSYKEICLASKQFSCWNEGDPNRNILLDMGEKIINSHIIDERDFNASFHQCLYVAKGIILDKIIDNVGGAVNYMTNDLFYSNDKPKWALGATNVRNIGNHMFFNA